MKIGFDFPDGVFAVEVTFACFQNGNLKFGSKVLSSTEIKLALRLYTGDERKSDDEKNADALLKERRKAEKPFYWKKEKDWAEKYRAAHPMKEKK